MKWKPASMRELLIATTVDFFLFCSIEKKTHISIQHYSSKTKVAFVILLCCSLMLFFRNKQNKAEKILASFIVPDSCLDLFIFYVYVILIKMEIKKISSFLNHVFKISNKNKKKKKIHSTLIYLVIL